jgi:hypothetical protein
MATMDGLARLLDTTLRTISGWAFVAIAVVCGAVLWAPDETAGRYGFDRYRFEHGFYLYLGFWFCLALAIAWFLHTASPSTQALNTHRRQRLAIRKKMAALTPDEQAILYWLHVDHRDWFRAGDDAKTVRKLRLAGLVEHGGVSGRGWMTYRVPALVHEVLQEFIVDWEESVAQHGHSTPRALHALVQQLLDVREL